MATESLDYDAAEHNFVLARDSLSQAQRRRLHLRIISLTVATIAVVGAVIGSTAFLISYLVEVISTLKWRHSDYFWYRGEYVAAWLVLLSVVTVLALLAAGLTLWAPQAAGSGIPHVKAYLNGVKVPGMLQVRTLFAKVLGISFCVAMGIPVGREGPMVHAGAIAASLAGRALSAGLKMHKFGPLGTSLTFDNDFHRRKFVSVGAAAGVAAAFHAPIGGILFSLEEVRAEAAGQSERRPVRAEAD